MRIQIQEAYFYADPCGSGSKTLMLTKLYLLLLKAHCATV